MAVIEENRIGQKWVRTIKPKREKIQLLADPESHYMLTVIHSVQFSSVTQSCLTLCNPMDCSTLGLAVPHQLPESTQTHVHWVGDAI